jgi:hypothetical protein
MGTQLRFRFGLRFGLGKCKITSAMIFFALMQISTAQAMNIGFNGCGSAYAGQALNPHLLPANFVNKNIDFTHFSLMGLNVNGSPTDDIAFAAQFIATGGSGIESNYILYAQWAFLNYMPNDSLSIKAGRQLFPVWLASEYVRVGYLLPFRGSSLLYSSFPFVAFDGVSVHQDFETGIGKLTLGAFGGSPFLDTAAYPGSTYSMANLIGAHATLDGEGWRLHAQASTYRTQADVTSPVTLTVVADPQIYTLGYRIDKSGFVSWGEASLLQAPDGENVPPIAGLTAGGKYVARATSGYILGGYRIGKFLPRYTYARYETDYGLFPKGSLCRHIRLV